MTPKRYSDFLAESISYSYTVPDRVLMPEVLYDFYAWTFLYSVFPDRIEQRGQKASAFFTGGESNFYDLKKIIEEAVQTIVDFHTEHLLHALIVSMASEIRHLLDATASKDGSNWIRDNNKIIKMHESKKFRAYLTLYSSFDIIAKHSFLYSVKTNKGQKSLNAVLDTYGTNLESLKQFVKDARDAFRGVNKSGNKIIRWDFTFGGDPWADGCDAWLELYANRNTPPLQRSDYIDHCWDLEHNNGVYLNKVEELLKNSGYSWIKDVLNYKRDKSFLKIIEKSSIPTRIFARMKQFISDDMLSAEAPSDVVDEKLDGADERPDDADNKSIIVSYIKNNFDSYSKKYKEAKKHNSAYALGGPRFYGTKSDVVKLLNTYFLPLDLSSKLINPSSKLLYQYFIEEVKFVKTTLLSQKSSIDIPGPFSKYATEIYFYPNFMTTSAISEVVLSFMKKQVKLIGNGAGVLVPTNYTTVGNHYGKTAYTGLTFSAFEKSLNMFAIQEDRKIVTTIDTLMKRFPLMGVHFQKLHLNQIARKNPSEIKGYSTQIDMTYVRNPVMDAAKYYKKHSNRFVMPAWVVYHFREKQDIFVPITSIDDFKPGSRFFLVDWNRSSKYMYVFDVK